MNRKRKILLVVGFILLLCIGLFVGRYLLPSCSIPPDCPDCPDCPECPEYPEDPPPPTLTVEKWVQNTYCDCGWQKEISAEKGDWIEVRILVSVNQTMNNVWVKDAGLASDLWTRVRDLQVDGAPFSGDIREGISLGKLTDESKEIRFKAQLTKSSYRYNCGENILENWAEAGDCGFPQASEPTRIMVKVHCSPSGGGDKETEVRPPEVHTDPNG